MAATIDAPVAATLVASALDVRVPPVAEPPVAVVAPPAAPPAPEVAPVLAPPAPKVVPAAIVVPKTAAGAAAPADRPSLVARFLYADVLLPAIAVLIVLAVLLAWVG